MDNDRIESMFAEGFNAGYELKRLDPSLFDKLVKLPNKESHFFAGFESGGKELANEREVDVAKKQIATKRKDSRARDDMDR